MVGFQEAEINSASQRLLDSHLRQFANKELIHMQVCSGSTTCVLSSRCVRGQTSALNPCTVSGGRGDIYPTVAVMVVVTLHKHIN